MQPVQRTQSLEEVLIARDVSPQSSPSSGPAVQTFTRLPITQVPKQDQAAQAGRSSYTDANHTSRRQLDMEQHAAQPEHEPARVSAAPVAGPSPEDGSAARSKGSYMPSIRQIGGQKASRFVDSGGGGVNSGGSGGAALPELRVGGGASGGSAAGRQLELRLPRIVSNESLVLVRLCLLQRQRLFLE